jgi:hypothetical protein
VTVETDPNATSPAPTGDETAQPVVEQETAPTEAETEVQAESAETQESEAAESDEADKPKQDDKEREFRRLKRRNEKLLQERAIERAERERLAGELSKLKAKPEGEEEAKPAEDPRAIAALMVAAQKTAEATAKVMKEGKKLPDFEDRVKDLVAEIGPQIDNLGQPTPLMDAILDSDMAAQVMHYLGDNTEVAAELAGLSPARIGRRISQIERELAAAAKPKPSAAAKPLTPVKPAAVVTVDPTKMSDREWMMQQRKLRQSA